MMLCNAADWSFKLLNFNTSRFRWDELFLRRGCGWIPFENSLKNISFLSERFETGQTFPHLHIKVIAEQMSSTCREQFSDTLKDYWDRRGLVCFRGPKHSISIQTGWQRPRGLRPSLGSIPLWKLLFPLLTISVKVEPTMHLTPGGSGGAATVEDCGRAFCRECGELCECEEGWSWKWSMSQLSVDYCSEKRHFPTR